MGKFMTQDEEKILKITKEIVIKFIEIGRLSPTGFAQCFKDIFYTIKEVLEKKDSKPSKSD
ncbi:MAG TPA: hypothetical protein ENG63_10750 [Candidatus Desulfofervidus auxilii]|uniref:Conjugal transfer protein TraB n=1 Tax=Desulfofervidus auxilii TaxID=1621989 RepID=A0A7C0Y5V7_DESA2|nr:hypothetical protein [Candidatus Desulfofervidus auxilii]HDD45317.1 hypothetical protein [Candidatus Desulfofervidus auxilii]